MGLAAQDKTKYIRLLNMYHYIVYGVALPTLINKLYHITSAITISHYYHYTMINRITIAIRGPNAINNISPVAITITNLITITLACITQSTKIHSMA